ncbi:MAG: alpha/beta fold hydrolase [Pseudomonadota bacterium]
MNPLAKRLLDQSLAFNQRFSETAANSFDWLFKRDTLVKSGQTWFELIHDGDPMSVRYYEMPGEDEIELADGSFMPIERDCHDIPLVLVPPLGVTTETFDLMPQRSLVRYMVARGFKTYLIDWGKPTKDHSRLNLKDYSLTMMSEALEKIRAHSGNKAISLMGWCMGGLLCLMHQGQTKDPDIRNIVTVASPIDLEGGGMIAGVSQALNAPAQLVKSYSRFSIDPSLMSAPPWLTTMAFKMTAPVASVTTYWDLLTRLWDREFVESHSTTSDYLNNMLRYPGGVLQDMTSRMIVDNQLAKGKLELSDGSLAELDEIKSSLLVFAGETDHLVPPSIAQASADIVASDDTEFHIAPGGHMGVILGSKAQRSVWRESANWLESRSRAC